MKNLKNVQLPNVLGIPHVYYMCITSHVYFKNKIEKF